MTALDERPVELLGKAEPRLWTRPLRVLAPRTSLGFEVIAFARDVLDVELLPWQEWWLVHALELRQDGRSFRYSTILTLISRQNGKTFLIKVLALWYLYVHARRLGHPALILGSAQELRTAKEAWEAAVQTAQTNPDLAAEIPRNGIRIANGEQTLKRCDPSGKTLGRYMITATTASAGRGLSVDLLILDEIRHMTSPTWAALSNTTIARPNSLKIGISNQGDDSSEVLNDLRAAALAGDDDALGIFEWSGPDGCELDDPDAMAQANPALGHGDPVRLTWKALRSMLAVTRPAVWRTENLCQKVDVLAAAIDPTAWAACGDPALDLGAWRDRLCYCVDVSYDEHGVTLAAAAQLPDGEIVGAAIASWNSTREARDALRTKFAEHRPRVVGWFPGGPTAAIGADITAQHIVSIGRQNVAQTEMLEWAPGVVELHGGVAVQACQSLESLVTDGRFRHADQALINTHILASARKDLGDGWRFMRKGAARNEGAYALAGAVHLAQTLPPTAPAPRSAIF